MKNGFLILDKPLGISSAKAVSEVKRLLKCKKIGHGGTLDPLASGVLPLAIGEATKAFDYVASSIKQYRFTITFGEERDTDDAEGQVVASTDMLPTREATEAVLPQFIGKIQQTPPAFSALKINGERAYKLARAGDQVEMVAREVEVFSLVITNCHPREGGDPSSTVILAPDGALMDSRLRGNDRQMQGISEVTLEVTCGKGTYVRSLARDIARKVNSLGYVSALRRTAVGKFHENRAISLEKLAELVHSGALFEAWVTLELALDDIPAIEVDMQQALKIRQGQAVSVQAEDGRYLALAEQRVLALCKVEQGVLRSMRVFNLN